MTVKSDNLIASIVPLPRAMPPVLGVGAYLKNALCLIQGAEAWISRENGSLDSVEAITRFQETAKAMIEAATIKPIAVARDWHPDFYCSRWAEDAAIDPKLLEGASFRSIFLFDALVRRSAKGEDGCGERKMSPESDLVSKKKSDSGLNFLSSSAKPKRKFLRNDGSPFMAEDSSLEGTAAAELRNECCGFSDAKLIVGAGVKSSPLEGEDLGEGVFRQAAEQGPCGETPAPVPSLEGRGTAAAGVECFAIQHHHAHVAAVMAEHGIDQPVLGLALDGFGLGERNESWGGELLRVDRCGFQRLGHLALLPQPGGDIAARQPWRMGAAALFALGRSAEIASRYQAYAGAGMLAGLMARQLNAPLTSSCGRLFDAACGLLNVVPVAQFEGEAPMKLESMVTQPIVDPQGWQIGEGLELDLGPTLGQLVGMEQERGANLFHGTLAAALLDWTRRAVAQTGITQVALCGGCFFNKVLRGLVVQGMMVEGITPLLPKQMLVGDTAIALGQAYAAALRLESEGE